MDRSSRTAALQLGTILLGVFIAFAFSVHETVSAFDGGILPAGASFILHGQLPYRDFWMLYGPLGAYIVAMPTAVLGPSVELVRALGLLVALAFATLSWLLMRRASAGFVAVPLVIAATAIPILVLGPELSAWNLSVTLAIAAFCVLAYRSGKSALVVAGAILGFAFLTRLDVGAYALIASVLVFRRRWLLAGFVAIAAPATLIALALIPVDGLVEQLIWFPLIGQRIYRELPEPGVIPGEPAGLIWIAVVGVPRGAIVAGLVSLARGGIRDRPSQVLLGFAILCQAQTLARADYYHFALAAPPAILLGAIVLSRARWPSRTVDAVAASLVAVVLLGGFLHGSAATGGASVFEEQLQVVSRTIESLTCPGEPIYIAAGRNRYTFSNPLILYYLSDRPAGALYSMFNPGVTNTDPTQSRIVSELESRRVRLLVLDESVSDWYEPQNESRTPGSTILDTYIDANFTRYADIGPFRILLRSGSSPRC